MKFHDYREQIMIFPRHSSTGLAAVAIAALVVGWCGSASAQQKPALQVAADAIGGQVTGANGPEAGVWVIAETTDLPTKYAKMVVTNDSGQFVIPQLPNAKYKVWARGYGLVDSDKQDATPGKTIDLKAKPAPNAAAAAEYYPGMYWYSMLKIPPTSEFPGSDKSPTGMPAGMQTQADYIDTVKNSCQSCHALGSQNIRSPHVKELGEFKSSEEMWARRIQSGQALNGMALGINRIGPDRAYKMFADWTDRVAKGELPFDKPERPKGIERNVVITSWEWGKHGMYLHDEIATDKRNPTVNANGPIYGALEESADYLPTVDPSRNAAGQVKMTVRDPKTPSAANTPPPQPSPYWGDEVLWNSQTTTHSFAMDGQGRVWAASRVRQNQTSAFCQAGSDNVFAKAFPITQSGRQIEMYDPKTKQNVPIDTCFSSGHLNFDKNNILWSSFGPNVEGWFDVNVWDKTHDEQKAQGWSAFVLDNNGNGKRDAYTEPDQPADPTKDRRINVSFYGVSPAPDGSVWGTVQGVPGGVARMVLGSNPPATTLTEYYEVPFNNPKAAVSGFAPRGMDVDSKGVVWTVLSSGQLASFDRRLCKGPLSGPTATGQHCPEGWKLYAVPGPNYKNAVDSASADSLYYDFVDQFNMLGVGKDVPIATGNESEALLALVDGKFLTLRVPYPMGFFAKGMDGRIDNPNAGWKGRAIYTALSTRAPFHGEEGKGETSKLMKFQVRPTPLSK